LLFRIKTDLTCSSDKIKDIKSITGGYHKLRRNEYSSNICITIRWNNSALVSENTFKYIKDIIPCDLIIHWNIKDANNFIKNNLFLTIFFFLFFLISPLI